jgi:hypothetical protein
METCESSQTGEWGGGSERTEKELNLDKWPRKSLEREPRKRLESEQKLLGVAMCPAEGLLGVEK